MNVMTLVTRKMRPNPANLRIADRSVVARDSSWPDCQLSWKEGGSCCRWAYRSSLMVFSIAATASAWIHRRIRFSAAITTPRPIAARASGISSLLSPCPIARSTTDMVSSGMTISAATAPSAAASMTIIWTRNGFR